jgi:hypothetical protein
MRGFVRKNRIALASGTIFCILLIGFLPMVYCRETPVASKVCKANGYCMTVYYVSPGVFFFEDCPGKSGLPVMALIIALIFLSGILGILLQLAYEMFWDK